MSVFRAPASRLARSLTAALGSCALAHAHADVTVYRSAGGDVEVRVGARLHLDGLLGDTGGFERKEQWRVRRGRLSFRADVRERWRLRLEYDAADAASRYRQLWLQYRTANSIRIRLGQFQEPFGLEVSGSSNDITFMERGLPSALAPPTSTGLAVYGRGTQWTGAGGIFLATGVNDSRPLSLAEGAGITARFTHTPLRKRGTIVHLGLSGTYRLPGDDETVRFRTAPESALGERLVDTGRIRRVQNYATGAAELAAAKGPLLLQGEYFYTVIDRERGRSEVDFDAGYVYASWLATGERRRYLPGAGQFAAVRPKSKHGALELALRYSRIDLNSGPVDGGEEENVTAGVNWYLNRHVRVMLNYVRMDTDELADDPEALQMRVQAVL